MSAESIYLFRHAVLRDAAYQLQLPSGRARLHGLAFSVIEELCGGRPPGVPSLEKPGTVDPGPHVSDGWAEDLAEHARAAGRDDARTHYLRRAAVVCQRQYRADDAVRLWRLAAGETSGPARGEALLRGALAYLRAGRALEAEPLVRDALPACREPAESHLESEALHTLAQILQQSGRFPEALDLCRTVLSRAESAGNVPGQRTALTTMTMTLTELGRVQEALAAVEKALALPVDRSRASDALHLASVQANHAILLMELARLDEAEALYRQALASHRSRGERSHEGIVLANLANLLKQTGRLDEADGLYGQALAIHRETGNRRHIGVVLGQMGSLARWRRRFPEAERLYAEALAVHRELGHRRFEGIVLGQLANLLVEVPRPAEAERCYEDALAIHREIGNERSEGVECGNLAALHAAEGRPARALPLLERALQLHEKTGNKLFLGVHSCGLGLVLLQLGRGAEGREVWRRGHAILVEVDTAELVEEAVKEMREQCAKAGVEKFG